MASPAARTTAATARPATSTVGLSVRLRTRASFLRRRHHNGGQFTLNRESPIPLPAYGHRPGRADAAHPASPRSPRSAEPGPFAVADWLAARQAPPNVARNWGHEFDPASVGR